MVPMIGTPIEVTARGYPDSSDGMWWRFKGPSLFCPVCNDMEFFGFLDADLQRLRGPGVASLEDGAADLLRHLEGATP